MTVSSLPATKASQNTFYPTPQPLIDTLLSGIDWDVVGAVLEPSAGKGDLATAIISKLKTHSRLYNIGSNIEIMDVDCIEIDPDLRHILVGKKLRVIHDDFLTLRTYKRYGAIIMNPPFDRGAEHLLKALGMQKQGGYVACILNAETLKNPYTNARHRLCNLLAQYKAEITYHSGAFLGAARRTGVSIAIVKVIIPYEDEPDSTILDGMRAQQKEQREERPADRNELAKDDYIEAIVDRFCFEAGAGCRLIQEYRALRPYLDDSAEKDKVTKSPLMSIIMGSVYSGRSLDATENAFIRAMRKKYWTALFTNQKFISKMTSNLKNELMESVERLQEYDFSVFNIMTIRVNMQKKVVNGIHDTILMLFDDWTRKYHWDEYAKNTHFFDGWRTNDAFAVNKRVIIPGIRGAFDDWSGVFRPTYYGTVETLSDIEKVFDYLSGNRPDPEAIQNAMRSAQEGQQTRKIPLRYFNVTFYKKGTCHIEFTDLDVLHKFNLYAARDKNWLPPCYGRKRYEEMNTEEQKAVDAFEGQESYAQVMARSEYFLSGPAESVMLRLEGGESYGAL